MKVRDSIRERLSNHVPGALNSGYTLAEIEADLDRREQVLKQVEKKVDVFSNEKKEYLQKAADESNPRKKTRYFAKAKKAGMHKSFWAQLWENLMVQQFFLTNLTLEASKRDLMQDPTGELGLQVDIGAMNAEAIRDALEDTGLEQTEIEDTIEQVDMHFNHDGDSGLSMDLEEIKSEAQELEDLSVGDGEAELGSGMQEAMDEQIEEELKRMQEAN